MSTHHQSKSLLDPAIAFPAVIQAFKKLDPRHQVKNPVMFVVFIGSLLTTGLYFQASLNAGYLPAH